MWQRIRRVLARGPRAALRRAFFLFQEKLRHVIRHCRDRLRSSFAADTSADGLNWILAGRGWGVGATVQGEWLRDVTRLYMEHRFDLLGSGWVQVRHGMPCRGLEDIKYPPGAALSADRHGHWLRGRVNRANLTQAQGIWRLVDDGYVPIDWQLDFKSGYRWSEQTWYLAIPYSHCPGVDVKVPWELARMQHLPQLALAFQGAQQERSTADTADAYAREFRNQVLDFVATNPPRFGVNWRCTMDVAIRAANWLIAYDMFMVFGAKFDDDFARVFTRSICEHGRHIVENLETQEESRNNHYLADIVGLLFISAYLPSGRETDAWLAFAARELVREVGCQFLEDGANFEASTCYHRLSAEMVVYATALIAGLPPQKQTALRASDRQLVEVCPAFIKALGNSENNLLLDQENVFPPWYIKRLERMGEFTAHLTKPGGRVPQIGDNDSARFVKIWPVYHAMTVRETAQCYLNLQDYQNYTGWRDQDRYWQEEHLDHRHLRAALGSLFARADFAAVAEDSGVESAVLRGLSGGAIFRSYRHSNDAGGAETLRVGAAADWQQALSQVDRLPESAGHGFRVLVPGRHVWDGLELYGYPDFGMYIFRSARIYLAIRCGPAVLKIHGAHAHNDQLSIELNVDGEDWIVDPGTYLYTPLPSRRNEYRSVQAHPAPRLRSGVEPGSFAHDLFWLDGDPQGRCVYFGREGFVGRHSGYGPPVYRLVRLTESGVEVTDWIDGPGSLAAHDHEVIDAPVAPRVLLSPGYGIQLTC